MGQSGGSGGTQAGSKAERKDAQGDNGHWPASLQHHRPSPSLSGLPPQHQPPALSMETRSSASQGLRTRAFSPRGALHPSFRRSNPSLSSGLRWVSSPQGPETWLAASITCTHGASGCGQDASRLHCKLSKYRTPA